MTELDPRYAATAGLEMALDLSLARVEAARVRAYAEQPEHVYTPGPVTLTPGDQPDHVFESGNHRVVYSITRDADAGTLYRHMSVSLIGAAPGKHAVPPAVFTLATYLGFTGGKTHIDITIVPGDDWGIDAQVRDDGLGIIVVVQVFSGGV